MMRDRNKIMVQKRICGNFSSKKLMYFKCYQSYLEPKKDTERVCKRSWDERMPKEISERLCFVGSVTFPITLVMSVGRSRKIFGEKLHSMLLSEHLST